MPVDGGGRVTRAQPAARRCAGVPPPPLVPPPNELLLLPHTERGKYIQTTPRIHGPTRDWCVQLRLSSKCTNENTL